MTVLSSLITDGAELRSSQNRTVFSQLTSESLLRHDQQFITIKL